MNFKFNLISFIFVLIIFLKFDHDDITAAEDLCDCYWVLPKDFNKPASSLLLDFKISGTSASTNG